VKAANTELPKGLNAFHQPITNKAKTKQGKETT
jgi:hypothetical protein